VFQSFMLKKVENIDRFNTKKTKKKLDIWQKWYIIIHDLVYKKSLNHSTLLESTFSHDDFSVNY